MKGVCPCNVAKGFINRQPAGCLLCAVSNAFGQVQQIVYDINDRPVSATDANGITTSMSYDAAGRVTTRTYPTGGGVEQYGYSTNVAAATSYPNQIGYVTTYYILRH